MKSYKQIVFEENKNNPNAHIIEGPELRKLQKTLLEIYLDVQEVCINNGIQCMLLGGSALGCVRHHGFIPWDDDLDLGMSRRDFEKFKSIFNDQLGDKYVLNSPGFEGTATNRFPKVLKTNTKFVELGMIDDDRACIKIDIFIIENIPNSFLSRYFKGFFCTILMFISGHVLSYEDKKLRKEKFGNRERIGFLFSFRSSAKWFDLFDKVVICKDEKSRSVGIPSGRKHYFGEILDRSVVFPVAMGVFEGKKAFLPHNADAYLTNLYGNYMQMPPEEKREKHYVEKIVF